MQITNPNIVPDQINNSNNWFDEMVANIRYDEQLFKNDIMENEQKKFYQSLIDGNIEDILSSTREKTSSYFIVKLVSEYFKELISSKKHPKKIAIDLSDSKILIWAEIYSDDEEMENALILSQAKINAIYSKHGFHLSSTIVDDCDNFQIPSHYKNIPINIG
ncbi:hypothetical protein QQY79_01560 [Flavobacterium tructae]|uniref:hypothetical protein n=1 Tax=Flavobacterium tructae TaxID=1114873 RepID=UPI00255207F3|nr:hypothetical protein [Flavobacterium tructae]MDL2141192.1 hypothetical protein [Flavobacterium tructae]